MNTLGTKTVANKDSYVDYGYDDNGNLVKDRNKDIGTSGSNGIVYNHLNLPCRITVEGKGTITYVYDALGNKLKKIVEDNTVNPVKKTTSTYMFGVYENDVLQFLGQEEGRLRPVVDGSGTLTGFSADYFLKDHLGNVRMVLADEEKTSTSAATFEDVNLTEEEAVFERVDIGRTPKPVVNDNSKVQLLSKSSNAVGVSKLLKVMAGDRIHVQVEYYTPDAGTDNRFQCQLYLFSFPAGQRSTERTAV